MPKLTVPEHVQLRELIQTLALDDATARTHTAIGPADRRLLLTVLNSGDVYCANCDRLRQEIANERAARLATNSPCEQCGRTVATADFAGQGRE